MQVCTDLVYVFAKDSTDYLPLELPVVLVLVPIGSTWVYAFVTSKKRLIHQIECIVLVYRQLIYT